MPNHGFNGPLPYGMATMGVSQDAIQTVRGGPPSGPTWASRLAAKVETMQKSQSSSSSLNPGPGMAAPTGHSEGPRYHVARLTARTMGQPLPREAYRMVTQHVTAQAGASGSSVNAGGRSSSHIDTSSLDSSKLFATEPQLVCVDFQAIADSSTGGAYNGLPRPYGRFMAVRNGDGLGLYERQPPPRIAQWHAKLTGVPSQGDGAGSAGPPSPERSANLSSVPSCTSAGDGPSTSPTRSVRGGTARSSGPHGPLPPPSPLDAVKFGRPETAAAAAAGGSAVGVDVLGRGPHSGWFKMPAATFLNRVPALPGGHLRIETGNTAARDFLMSGLHNPPPGRAGLSSVAAGGAGAWPGAAGAGVLGVLPPPPLGASGSFGATTFPAQGSTGGGEQLPSPKQPVSSSAHAGSISGSRAESPPGYRHLHGVFVPVDARVDTAVRASLGISPDGDTPAVPAATALLEAMSAAQRPPPTATHGAFEFATAHRRAMAQLPQERGLPRRHVPAVGK